MALTSLLVLMQLAYAMAVYVTVEYYNPSLTCTGPPIVSAQFDGGECYPLSGLLPADYQTVYPTLYNAADMYGITATCDAETVTVNQYYNSAGTATCASTEDLFYTTSGNTGSAAFCAYFTNGYLSFGSMSYRCSVLPCFSRDVSTACRLSDTSTPPSQAYDQCFGDAEETTAARVLMTDLRAGDRVLTVDPASGATVSTRVIVNQHVHQSSLSELLTVSYANGSIALTPDHVLSVDGEMASARTISPGAKLSMPTLEGDLQQIVVESVVKSTGGIINPLTASGTILAAADGAPVLATAYPEWIASTLLGMRLFPLPVSFSNLLSFAFPEQTQDFYDTHVEGFFWKNVHVLQDAEKVAPSAVKTLIIAGLDVLIAGAFSLTLCAKNAPAVALVLGSAALFKLRARK